MVIVPVGRVGAQDRAVPNHSFREVISYLASDEMQGRSAGSPEATAAAIWLSERFLAGGLQPITGFSFLQPFSYRLDTSMIQAINVIGKLGEGTPRLIVMAHYDHLRSGDPHSLEVFKDKIHNGADDNASGVAVLLRMAALLSKSQGPVGVVFACLSGHEDGLFGSRQIAASGDSWLEGVRWVVNLDMVGRLDTQYIPSGLFVRVPSDEVAYLLPELLPITGKIRPVIKNNSLPLDDQVFFEKGIQTCTFSTGIHSDYHMASDDVEKINFEGMDLVSDYIYLFLMGVLGGQ